MGTLSEQYLLVLLALECELWQSPARSPRTRLPVLLALECELWQSADQLLPFAYESCWPWNVNCGKALVSRILSAALSCWPWNVNCGKAFELGAVKDEGSCWPWNVNCGKAGGASGLVLQVLLALECELWQSWSIVPEETDLVLLALECELWQSRGAPPTVLRSVLLALECELWQSPRRPRW